MICAYDAAGNLIETHEHAGDFKLGVISTTSPARVSFQNWTQKSLATTICACFRLRWLGQCWL
jgi:hypothetical protein